MARPVRYSSEAEREALSRNPNINELGVKARKQATDRINSDDLGGRVEDPLSVLINEARASS